jgi:LysM repeat protein
MAAPRLFVIAALGVGPLVLFTACGADASGARTPLVPVQPSSYVVQDPVTTTTTTTTLAPPTPEAGAISSTEQSYTIARGDSLSKIAGLFGITIDDLIAYNQWADGINQLLLPGEVIRIPPNARVPGSGGDTTGGATAGGDPAAGGGTPATDPPVEGAGCTHIIESGENPSRVANQYDITVDELFAANPGGVMDTFLVGATLIIPPNGDC